MSGKASRHYICRCGCNRSVSQSIAWCHKHCIETRPESPPPPKQHHTAHFQVGQESFIITPDKQKQSRIDNISSNPSLPLLNPPPALNLLQLPEDALTEASGLFLDNFLLDLHTQTHQTTDQSDDEDSEGALEGNAVEAGDYIVHKTDDFWNGEDVDMDPHEGIVLGWDLLGEDFIVEAEELHKFGHSLLHTS